MNTKEYNRQYYLKHKEEIKSRSAEWKKNNKERAYETWKLYYEENKETIVNRSRQWYTENKEKSSETKSKYRNTPMGRACKLYWKYNQMDINAGRGLGDLTPEWIASNILTKPCAHCGEADWHKIGCNRLDNSKPHTMDNVEPCCYKCNVKLAVKDNSKKVCQYTLDGVLVKIWPSTAECGRNGFSRSSVSRCCNNIKETYEGFKWQFLNATNTGGQRMANQ